MDHALDHELTAKHSMVAEGNEQAKAEHDTFVARIFELKVAAATYGGELRVVPQLGCR